MLLRASILVVAVILSCQDLAIALEDSKKGEPESEQAGEEGGDTEEPVLPVRWYAGAAFGRSEDRETRDDDSTVKLFGGLRAGKYVALEWALVGLGDFGPGDALTRDGISLDVVGILPIKRRFELFGKVGAFYWEITDIRFCSGVSCPNVDDGIDTSYGAGFQFHFAPKAGARLEWQRFTDVGPSDVDLVSLGFFYGF